MVKLEKLDLRSTLLCYCDKAVLASKERRRKRGIYKTESTTARCNTKKIYNTPDVKYNPHKISSHKYNE